MRYALLCFLLVFGLSPTICGQQPKAITNSIGMKLVLIHAGSFTMGAPVEETGRRGDEAAHEVTISKSYYLGVYETTQREFEKVTGKNPSRSKGADNPVEMVSWDEATLFCSNLSQLPAENASGRTYRLPSEAEWEYACRAISTTAYSFGDTPIGNYAWFDEHRFSIPHPVGENKANRWGLFDMHGNVSEWCQDWYGSYPLGEATDPIGPIQGEERIMRGGCLYYTPAQCRSAYRESAKPKLARSSSVGFRVAMSLTVKQNDAPTSK